MSRVMATIVIKLDPAEARHVGKAMAAGGSTFASPCALDSFAKID